MPGICPKLHLQPIHRTVTKPIFAAIFRYSLVMQAASTGPLKGIVHLPL